MYIRALDTFPLHVDDAGKPFVHTSADLKGKPMLLRKGEYASVQPDHGRVLTGRGLAVEVSESEARSGRAPQPVVNLTVNLTLEAPGKVPAAEEKS